SPAETAQLGFDMEIPETPSAPLKARNEVPHDYRVLTNAEEAKAALDELRQQTRFAFHLTTEGTDPKSAEIKGIAFAAKAHSGWCLPVTGEQTLEWVRDLLESETIEKTGHDLTFALSVLRWKGITVRGPLFDTQ